MIQTCFDYNELPNIPTFNDLAVSLCDLQQSFDKCPAYLTKKDYAKLLSIINGSLFHLYKYFSDIMFMGFATTATNPQLDSESLNKSYPGLYILTQAGTYINFINELGNYITLTEEELQDAIVFAIPKFHLEDNSLIFDRYDKIIYQLNVTFDGGEIEQ